MKQGLDFELGVFSAHYSPSLANPHKSSLNTQKSTPMFNADFDKCVQLVLDREGDYVNDPRDPSGETKYGISKRAYPDLDITNLTVDQAKAIYKRDYWDKAKCDELPESVALAVFDGAVNHGVMAYVASLQKALRVDAEGIIGPIKLGAARRSDR